MLNYHTTDNTITNTLAARYTGDEFVSVDMFTGMAIKDVLHYHRAEADGRAARFRARPVGQVPQVNYQMNGGNGGAGNRHRNHNGSRQPQFQSLPPVQTQPHPPAGGGRALASNSIPWGPVSMSNRCYKCGRLGHSTRNCTDQHPMYKEEDERLLAKMFSQGWISLPN